MSLSCGLPSSWVSCLLILLLPYCSASRCSDPLGSLLLLQVSLPINSTFLSNGECFPERNAHVHFRRTLCSSCYTGLISRSLSQAETGPEPFNFPSYRVRSAQDEHLGVWSTSQSVKWAWLLLFSCLGVQETDVFCSCSLTPPETAMPSCLLIFWSGYLLGSTSSVCHITGVLYSFC